MASTIGAACGGSASLTFVTAQLRTGRGRVTVYRVTATISSALSSAVYDGRLARNPAKPSLLRRPT
ncbi:hypothetical protein GCM10010193_25770 [Kitasatospora atroaurantiaca]|nr:hypothetical protein [Kitasatospora atroaurantiaca]